MVRDKQKIWKQLLAAERDARVSKFGKWLRHPVKYPLLMGFDYAVYPFTRRSILYRAHTFFGKKMWTRLPAGTDIVLHTIKAHDSEIRLSKFLCLQLHEGDTFIDVGAHYGYYTLMASALVGGQGHVFAIEASATTSETLISNVAKENNVTVHQAAASDTRGEILFYEYPGPYAEWNTTVRDAYKDQAWLKKIPQMENRVPAILLDDLIFEKGISKAIIKIDAEGGELGVIRGLMKSLPMHDLTVIMEYHRSMGPEITLHQKAAMLLKENGYSPFVIQSDGTLRPIQDIGTHLTNANLDSDNLVFMSSSSAPFPQNR